MKRILITGAQGFLGRNMAAHVKERKDCEIVSLSRENSIEEFKERLLWADVIFHLAGVNRPNDPIEFEKGNAELTEGICQLLLEKRRSPKIVFSSSIHAELENAYGASKARAEKSLRAFASEAGASVRAYRLKNLFGKWCRPHYNAVTATFCHCIARDLPFVISDAAREVELSYVDDVVMAFLEELESESAPHFQVIQGDEIRSYRIQLGDLAGRIQAFHEMSASLMVPDFSDWFNRALYATYLSYVPSSRRKSSLDIKADPRGSLAEFIKEKHFGQVFISRTKPGVTRGNHYHHTKTEKFFVVEGEGLIRMRSIEGGPLEEYPVKGSEYQIIDIPPGFTHSISNVGTGEMVTLFWSSEIFDPDRTDTYYLPVDFREQQKSAKKRCK